MPRRRPKSKPQKLSCPWLLQFKIASALQGVHFLAVQMLEDIDRKLPTIVKQENRWLLLDAFRNFVSGTLHAAHHEIRTTALKHVAFVLEKIELELARAKLVVELDAFAQDRVIHRRLLGVCQVISAAWHPLKLFVEHTGQSPFPKECLDMTVQEFQIRDIIKWMPSFKVEPWMLQSALAMRLLQRWLRTGVVGTDTYGPLEILAKIQLPHNIV